MKRALFLDRDGTLIVDRNYLADPAGVELLPGAADGLRRARELGFLLFMLSNQSGIGRGYHTLGDALRVNTRMEEMLGLPAPVFDGVCIAPEAPGEPSRYRKPSPRFIHEMIEKHDLDPRECFMVGDRLDDARAGLNAGVTPVLLLTGKIIDPATVPEIAEHRIAVHADFGAFAATLR
jgi:D-glycero-D-manno-heptose 1,7-bisphosphate phosphatase